MIFPEPEELELDLVDDGATRVALIGVSLTCFPVVSFFDLRFLVAVAGEAAGAEEEATAAVVFLFPLRFLVLFANQIAVNH